MRIKLHSMYDHFPNHHPVDGEPYINCYNDTYVKGEVEPGSIALLIEPRSIQPGIYAYMEQNYKRFRMIFTHDSKLIELCDNAKLILWGGGCGGISQYKLIPKTKCVSMVSSNKTMCDLHVARIELARALRGVPRVDVMGTVDGGLYVEPDGIYQQYRFSIAFENYIDNDWFTEKICNCFANKVVPLYYGARDIGKYFNRFGIYSFKEIEHLKNFVINHSAWNDWEMIYDSLQPYIEDNYKRVQAYATFEQWFFNEYEGLLNDLHSETQGI